MSWSLSSLGTYEKCGLKYKFKYHDKLKETRSIQASRGVDNHALVEGFLRGELKELPPELSFYSQFLTGLKTYEIYPEHKVSLHRDWNPTTWEDPEVWYKGVLDLKVVKNEGEALVYDWKTGKIYPDHNDQKTIYSLAVFAEHPALYTVRAIHVYLDLNANREKTFHRNQVPELRKQWETRVQRLEQDPQFIANPGFHCRWCGYSRTKGGPCQF